MGWIACRLVLACGLVVVACNESFARTSGEASVLAHIPSETLVAARVARLDKLDAALQPLATNFGLTYPPIGQMATQLDGIDATGEAVVGIAEYESEVYLPFVLLPVSDYRAVVRAGDGDAGIEVTPLTLAGEELLASQRGEWALVTNVVEQFAALGQVDGPTAQQFANHLGDELLTVVVTEAGLDALKAIATAPGESPRQLANRRRMLSIRPMNWRSLDQWRQRVSLQPDMVERLHSRCSGIVLAVDTDEQLQADLRAVFIPRGEVAEATARRATGPLELPDQRTVATAACAWNSPWVEWLLQMYLGSFSVGSDEVGVQYFRAGDFERFRGSIAAAGELIDSVQFLMIAPPSDKPTMSNSALLATVADADKFVAGLDEAVTNWNRMIETARRSIDFLYEIKPLEVGELAGKRYAIDLPTAFRQDNVPEVREVLDRMYGRNGVWAMDVLPVDDTHVLVSDLPDELRDQLLEQVRSGQPASQVAEVGWTVTLHPAVLQDWLNNVRLQSFGENVIGWKPKSLDSTGKVQIRLTTHAPVLTVESQIPSDVMKAVGELVRE